MSWWSFRNVLQKLHLWVGLALSIPLILICVSGSILILMNYGPALAIPAATTGPWQPIESMIKAAEASLPEGYTGTAVLLPDPGQAATVQLDVPRARRRADRDLQGVNVYVDPVSLKVLGTDERRRNGPLRRTLVELHIAMLASGHYGLQFVGFMGVFMTLFGITGLVLWWPKKGQWRYAFGVKRGARGWRLNRDLHGAFGFWTLIVFMILSVSGVYVSFPVTFTSVLETILPVGDGSGGGPRRIDQATLATIGDRAKITADEALRLARSVVPRARAVSVQVPVEDGAFLVMMMPEPYGNGAPTISVFAGPGSVVTDVVDPRGNTLGKRILNWMRVMHYGEGLGIIWSVLAILGGLLPVLFGITGLLMWAQKRTQRRSVPDGVVVPAE